MAKKVTAPKITKASKVSPRKKMAAGVKPKFGKKA